MKLQRTRILSFSAALALALVSVASADEGKAIFNGKDLTGWEGNPDLWSVQDGAITGTTKGATPEDKKSTLKHNTFLVWKDGTVGDFELTFKYRIVAGNSGVQYRSKELPKGEHGPSSAVTRPTSRPARPTAASCMKKKAAASWPSVVRRPPSSPARTARSPWWK